MDHTEEKPVTRIVSLIDRLIILVARITLCLSAHVLLFQPLEYFDPWILSLSGPVRFFRVLSMDVSEDHLGGQRVAAGILPSPVEPFPSSTVFEARLVVDRRQLWFEISSKT